MSTYQGHAGSGGLQNHSIGGLYPFTVFGRECEWLPGQWSTAYGVMNTATGEETPAVFTCAGAHTLASEIKAGRIGIGASIKNLCGAIVSATPVAANEPRAVFPRDPHDPTAPRAPRA